MTSPDPLAVAAMVGRCGWNPLEVKHDERVLLNGNGTALLKLPSLYVTDVSLVELLGVAAGVPTSTPLTVGPGGQVQWSDNGCLERVDCGVWPQGRQNIAVTYSGGYEDAPAELTAVLASISKRASGPLFGASSRRMGTAAVTFGRQFSDGDLLVVEQMVLDRYRIIGGS